MATIGSRLNFSGSSIFTACSLGISTTTMGLRFVLNLLLAIVNKLTDSLRSGSLRRDFTRSSDFLVDNAWL